MLPAFFDLRLRKWDTLENETTKLFVRLSTSPLSLSFIGQTEFTAFEKILINREVPLLFNVICFYWDKCCQCCYYL